MKLFLLSCVLVSIVDISMGCESNLSIICKSGRENNRYPPDCRKFVSCAGSTGYLMNCPSDLHYNVATDQCDYPANAKCEQCSSGGTPTQCQSNLSTICKSGKQLNAYPPNCRQFVHCSNGVGYLKTCPSNLNFNPATNVCDWPDSFACRSCA